MDISKVKTIEKLMSNQSKAQLKGLILELCQRNSDAYEYMLLWGQTKGNADVSEKLALEYWRKAERIIDDFNSYGGGPEKDEDEAYGYIEEIGKLIPKLSWKTRQEIMEGMLTQYYYHNSGFDDVLTDACFDMCKEREEWLYLAETLLGHGGSCDKSLVMSIYQTIGDDEAFLRMREGDLHYGCDYFELVDLTIMKVKAIRMNWKIFFWFVSIEKWNVILQQDGFLHIIKPVVIMKMLRNIYWKNLIKLEIVILIGNMKR